MGCVSGKNLMDNMQKLPKIGDSNGKDETPSKTNNDILTSESEKLPKSDDDGLERFETSMLEQPKRWGKRPAELCQSPNTTETAEIQEVIPLEGTSNQDNDTSRKHPEMVVYKGKEHGTNLSNPRNSKKHQRSYLSKDEQDLANLMNPESTNDAHTLRKALSDHVEKYEIVDENVDLEKKLSAEIGKEKEVNQSLRDFRGGSEARKSERRLSITPNRTSLHVIPEHHDEPVNPEIYQYSDANLYF